VEKRGGLLTIAGKADAPEKETKVVSEPFLRGEERESPGEERGVAGVCQPTIPLFVAPHSRSTNLLT
jgi:hypothetical protein